MVKKINKKQLSPSEHHFEVILEGIDSKLDLVIGGYQGLDKKIDTVDKKVDSLREEMDYKFEIVFEKFDKIDAQFSDVKDELHIIRNELKEKISRDEFSFLEKRVMALEKSRK